MTLIFVTFFLLVTSVYSQSVLEQVQSLEDALVSNGFPQKNFLTPTDYEYIFLNEPWQLKPPATQPLAFVLPRNERDVIAIVSMAAKLGIQIVAKAGGHSFEKFSYGDGSSVVVDLRLLDDVFVNPKTNTAAVGPGLLVGPLGWRLWEAAKVMTPTAFCPTVGITGSALGGGYGNFAGTYGLSLDNILELNVVNAQGQLLVVNSRSHADLFWAMRGGGQSLGIVTKFVFRTHPAPEAIFEGILGYNNTDFPFVADAFQRFVAAQDSPSQVTAEFEVRNNTNCRVRFTDVSGTDKNFQKIQKFFPPTSQITKSTFSFPDFLFYQAKILSGELIRNDSLLLVDSDLGKISRFTSLPVYQYRKSFYVQKVVGIFPWFLLQALAETMPSTVSMWFEGYGGTVRSIGVNETAFVHRGPTLYNAVASYKVIDPTDTVQNAIGQTFVDNFFNLGLNAFNQTQSYQNYVDIELTDYLDRYYGNNLERLVHVKAKYDPENFFNNPQGIPTTLAPSR